MGVYFFVKVTPVVSDNERKPYGLYKTYVIDFLMLQPWQPFRRKPFSYWDPDGTAGTADAEVLSGEPQSSGGRTVPKDCKDVTEIWELYFPIVV